MSKMKPGSPSSYVFPRQGQNAIIVVALIFCLMRRISRVEIMKQPNRSRGRRRRKRRRRLNWIAVMNLISLIMSFAIVIMICIMVKFSITQAKFVTGQVKYYDKQCTVYNIKVREIQKNEIDLMDKLYDAVKKSCKNSNNEVLIILWDTEFETDEVFSGNRSNGMISLYAILNNHPDVRYDVPVAQALYDLECNQTRLENTVDTYNMMFDSYRFWAVEYMDSAICYLTNGKLDPTKHLKIILE